MCYVNNYFGMQNQLQSSLTSEQIQPKMRIAVVSLVLGFLGCVMLGAFTAIPAVICGHIALSKLKWEQNINTYKRIALAGVILGYIGIIITVVITLGILMFFYNWGPVTIPTK